MLKSKIYRFDNAGYYFIILLLVALIGFMPSYFSKFTDDKVSYDFYTHFHAFNMSLWVALLIIQPFLVRNRKNDWHRWIGKFTYGFFPILIISVVLLMHNKLTIATEPLSGYDLYIPLKDIMVIVPCFCLAIYYRKNPKYHARFIIGSSMQVIEPGLVRALINSDFFASPDQAHMATLLTIDMIMIVLIINDRKEAKGRWIFPLILAMILTIQGLLLMGIPEMKFFVDFTNWFAGLDIS